VLERKLEELKEDDVRPEKELDDELGVLEPKLEELEEDDAKIE